ncbi:UNVERIFIED_CONTAM: hypothetical protein K2H54_015835 [Gekko kuhli]
MVRYRLPLHSAADAGNFRLVSLLTQALEECAEKQQQLQRDLALCRDVLGDWNLGAPDSPPAKDCSSDQQEKKPSAEELEELELLDKALEKALKIRTKFLSPVPLSEAKDGTRASEREPVAHVAVEQQGANCKPKSVKVRPVSQKPACPRKPSAYVLKAPYRTDLTVKRPQRKTSARLSCGVSKGSGRNAPQGAPSPKARMPVKTTKVECRKISVAENPRMLPGESDSPQDAKQSPLLRNSTGAGDFASAGPSCLDTEQHLSRESSPRVCTEPQTSTLQEKGASLKLPLPYRRASSKLTRLWQGSRHCQTSPEAAAARDCFVEKLEATFCSPSPSFSLVEVEKELMSLRDVYSLLSHSVEAEMPASLGENPTWEREYESLLALEGLQPMVSQCLDKVHQLQGAVESHRQFSPADPAREEVRSSPAEGPFLQRRRSCGAERLGAPPPLYYSSLKELQEVEDLRLQVAMLRQQIDLQKALEGELLPLLEPGPAPPGSRAPLYRAIYMLLCEGGQRFPALVSEEGLPGNPGPGPDGAPSSNLWP